MAVRTWTLVDQTTNHLQADAEFRPDDVGGKATGYQVTHRTLRCGLSAGVTTVRIDNGQLAVEVLPTRGMGIWKVWLGKEQEEIGWKSPVRGPVHPAWVPVGEPNGLGWLDGFDELLVRCGLESNGAPEMDDKQHLRYPLHGRIANKPAHRVELSIDGESGEIRLTGIVEETRFHFFKVRMTSTLVTRVGESRFQIRDELRNLSASPTEVQMLYHVNFGQPLLDAGARVLAPVAAVVPRNAHSAKNIGNWNAFAAEQPGFPEEVFFFQLAGNDQRQTQVLLRNAHGTRGVSLLYDTAQLPCFTLWKNTTALADGYVTGLEPGTNFPNPRSFEGRQGRTVKLAGGGTTTFDLGFQFHTDSNQVVQAEQAVAALQKRVQPKVYDQPQPDWCAP